jgi:hypothetical protein
MVTPAAATLPPGTVSCNIEPVESAAEPMVRGLSAGGRRIRTFGPP